MKYDHLKIHRNIIDIPDDKFPIIVKFDNDLYYIMEYHFFPVYKYKGYFNRVLSSRMILTCINTGTNWKTYPRLEILRINKIIDI